MTADAKHTKPQEINTMQHTDAALDAARKVAEVLQGTTLITIEQALVQIEANPALETDQTFCGELDQLVFECNECGWWCELSEMSNRPEYDYVCDDCAPDDDE